jgi:hypothetical protein
MKRVAHARAKADELPPANPPGAAPAMLLIPNVLQDVDEGQPLVPLTDLDKPARLDGQLKALIPKRTGKLPHISAWFRYASRGCRGVKLETIRTARGLCTTAGSIRRFYCRLSGMGECANVRPAAVRRETRRADELLDKAGL